MDKEKTVVIVEGPDGTGKTQLCKFLQDYVEGKCHIIHSNYNKSLPKSNNRRQHFLISKFVKKQFDAKHYTGNRLVILDRNYISDVVYGQIGYGSKGTNEYKFFTLDKLFKILLKNANVIVIYCNPIESTFNSNSEIKEELLNDKENLTIRNLYDVFFTSYDFQELLVKDNIRYYEYSFLSDPDYKVIRSFLERNTV